MKRVSIAGFFLSAAAALFGQTAPAACNASELAGTYSLTLTGRSVSSSGALSQAFLAVGTASFNGNGLGATTGTATFNMMADTNSATPAAQTWSGGYVMPSCMGTLTISSGASAVFTLIPYSSGASFTITGQDAKFVYSGSGTQQRSTCATATYTGAYVFSGNGYALASGAPVGIDTVAGLLEFDGAGGVSGSWSVATNTAATTATVTGHYSVAAPGCTASASVTDQNNVAYSFNFSISSANLANFAVLGTSSELMFTGAGHSIFAYPALAVEDAAGVAGGIPPGSLFSVYGYGMANGKAQAETVNWPTTLASAQVLVNNVAVPLYYADNAALGAEGLINAQMPLDVVPGPVTVVVKNGGTASNAVLVNASSIANPGVFILGTNHAAAQNFPGYATNSATAPAKAGSVVIVYFTGGGSVQGANLLTTGHPTPAQTFPLVSTNVNITVGGLPAAIDYIGLTPTEIGLYQAVIVVPNLAAGAHNVVITIDGAASNTTVISTN